MKRIELLKTVIDILEKAGFYVAHIREFPRVSFNLIARRDDLLIIVRATVNIDSLSREICNELKLISCYMNASLFVVGGKNATSPLKTGVVYTRYDVPIVSVDTLEELFLYGVQPLSHSAHGGFYVSFDSELLQEVRMERQIPLSTLAEKAGVSKRAIQMYEGGMDISIDAALRLEEFLDLPLIKGTEIFSKRFEDLCLHPPDLSRCNPFEKEVMRALKRIGTHVVPIYRCPFNALTGEDDSVIITGISMVNREFTRRVGVVSKISRISERRSMFIVDELKNRMNVNGTPLVGKKEIDVLKDPADIDRLIEDRVR